MTAQFGPFIRTPFSDLTGGVMTHQCRKECRDFEMNAVECLEAYGAVKGKVKCQDYLDDLKECMFQTKRVVILEIHF